MKVSTVAYGKGNLFERFLLLRGLRKKKNRIKSVAFLKIDLFLKETTQSPT